MHAIVSQRVVTPDGLQPAAVLVDGEHIVGVVPRDAIDEVVDGVVEEGVACTDVGDLVLMSGLVDCHVHINEPGRTEWEGFRTATRAAAAGGVTTLVDMPLNCTPVTTSVAAFETKLEACADQLHVDVGFWAGVVPGNALELPRLAAAGVLGAKAFLCHSGIDDFPRAERDVLEAAMPKLRDAGIPLLAHAELELDESGADYNLAPDEYDAWLLSRPRRWEDAAIELLVDLCRHNRCPVHIVHLSSASALPTLRAAKAEGLPITVETCPHYLCLRAEDVPDGDTTYKCAPPIRDDKNRQALWTGLFDGTIDFVVTDHSPCTPQLKVLDRGDFIEAWGGIASLSLGLSSVWTEAKARGATVLDMARWMSEAPARFAGLSDRKGTIAKGMSADLVAWDPDATFEVKKESLLFRHPISPYIGKTLSGRVASTWLRGTRIYDGKDVGGPIGAAILHRSE